MKVFISWSGTRSKAVASVFHEFLPLMIQEVEPWMSSVDIAKGTDGGEAIAKELESSNLGVICVTQENKDSKWIHYEAGALAKVTGARAWTFLIDMKYSEVQPPLSRFQHTLFEEKDVRQLLSDVNNMVSEVGGRSLTETKLDKVFESYWPQFEKGLMEALKIEADTVAVPQRKQIDMVEEILNIVRSQNERLAEHDRLLQPIKQANSEGKAVMVGSLTRRWTQPSNVVSVKTGPIRTLPEGVEVAIDQDGDGDKETQSGQSSIF